jgi:hypothetical protein
MTGDFEALEAAVAALEIGVFRQDDSAGFVSVGRVPGWMSAFSRNPSFPFLGSFLGQARHFWSQPQEGRLTWGPCTELNERGEEFHFLVSAISLPSHKLLVFELDHAAAPMRSVLQKVREQALHQTGNQTQPPRAPSEDTDPLGGDDTFLK